MMAPHSLFRVSEILKSLCNDFLPKNVSAILYLMNYEKYGRSTASAQYFLQLAGYLGIPVIAWNADNSGLERVSECKCSFFPFHSMECGKKKKKKRTSNCSRKIKAFCSIFGSNFSRRGIISLSISIRLYRFVSTFVDVYTFLDLEKF